MSREQKMKVVRSSVVCFVTEKERVKQERTMGKTAFHVASFGLCWRARLVLVAKNLPESTRSLVVCRSRQAWTRFNCFRFHHLTHATCHLFVIYAHNHATRIHAIRTIPDTNPFRV
jgi:hypothetical protein